jgi:23S rRNA (uridine2552-2'-O)-methyltransferase
LARARSSRRWLERHVRDPYVRKAQAEGYRSRAAYKLLEIDRRERLLRPGMRVVDLGAAPGGWSQVAAAKAKPGTVVAVDLLEIAPIPGVTVLEGNFLDPEVQQRIGTALAGAKADLVLSDLSPNISGIASADQARAAELVLAAAEFCRRHLSGRGALLVKVFQGEEFAGIVKELKSRFREVEVVKPPASRAESREIYVLCKEMKSH